MTPPNLTAASKTVKPVWSVEMFEQFWANPDPALVPPDIFAADVVGDWPGLAEPVRGVADYAQRLTDLMAILPDMRLEVAEHAVNGEYTFIRWILSATGAHGRFDLSGMDRVHVRDGQIVENVIRFDTAQFEARAGHPLPWS